MGYPPLKSLHDVVHACKSCCKALISLQRENELVSKFLSSEAYDRLFWEMVTLRNESVISPEAVTSEIEVHKWHDVVDIESEELGHIAANIDDYKKAFVIEILSQFRDGEMIPQYNFPGGSAIYQELGFNTDVSETCAWLSPLYREPEDPQDFM